MNFQNDLEPTGETMTSSLLVGSRNCAKTQALRFKQEVDNQGLKEKEQGCYSRCSELSMKSNQNILSQKMLKIFSEPTMEEILEQSSVNWMEWGIMQNGEFVERQKSVPPTTGAGCTWLLTPTASEHMRDNLSSPMWLKRYNRSAGGLSEQLHRLGFRGLMNHRFSLWMMGFPQDWTELPFLNGDQNQ